MGLANAFLCVAKLIIACYTWSSLPIYYAVQYPPGKRRRAERPRVKSSLSDDGHIVWSSEDDYFPDYVSRWDTMDSIFLEAMTAGKTNTCAGYRSVLEIHSKQDNGGKWMKKQVLSDYKWITCQEMNEMVNRICDNLIRAGVCGGDKVMLLGDTRLDWQLMAQAVYRVHAILVTSYSTLGLDAILHCINETEVKTIFVNPQFVPILLEAQKNGRVVSLERVIVSDLTCTSDVSPTTSNSIAIYSLKEWAENGSNLYPKPGGKTATGADLGLIMYTSGSTGVPKGVMLSHKNILSIVTTWMTVEANRLGRQPKDEVFAAYLPLSHIFEFIVECGYYAMGVKIGYATSLTLLDSSLGLESGVKGDITLLRPTTMICVPLVMDRLRAGIDKKFRAAGPFVHGLVNNLLEYKSYWNGHYYATPIIDKLLCRKIKAVLGGQVKQIICGGAPLHRDTHSFLLSALNIPIIQGYGATEVCAGSTLQSHERVIAGEVGWVLPGVEIILRDWEDGNYTVEGNNSGEILIGGDKVAIGYYKQEELTRESYITLNGKRYWCSGDIGTITENKSLTIVDRKKFLFKLAHGEYVAPSKIETVLINSPLVENIFVYGEMTKKSLVALVIPNKLAIEENEKMYEARMLQSRGEYQQTVEKFILEDIRRFGEESGLCKHELPAAIAVLEDQWTTESGHLTATMKMKRQFIEKSYAQLLSDLCQKVE